MFTISIISCRNKNYYSENINECLAKSGNNKSELVKALEHYHSNPSDSLKYKAACYLIENMNGHFSRKEITDTNTAINKSFQYIDSLTKVTYFKKGDSLNFNLSNFLHELIDTDDFIATDEYINYKINNNYSNKKKINIYKKSFTHFEHKSDSIFTIISKIIDSTNYNIINDLEHIKAKWLIDHIDTAFEVWKTSPYTKKLSFNEFCQTILPYRTREENIDTKTSFLQKNFYSIINKSSNIKEVVKRINFFIYCADVFEDRGKNIGNLGFYDILQFYKYDCDRHSEWTVRVLNACGIPAALDYTSRFFNRDKLHYGVSVMDTSGIYHHFTPKWQALGDTNHAKMFSKVFRRTFEVQETPFTLKNKEEEIPSVFNDSFIKDVTEEYHKVCNIDIPFSSFPEEINIGYIGIFTPNGWKPIGWGKINRERDEINLKKVPVNAVYISGYYKEGVIHPTSSPFYVNKKGIVSYIQPNFCTKNTINLTRKYPKKEKFLECIKEMVGAKIQGANKSDFSDAIDLKTLKISDLEDFSLKAFDIKVNKPFRYVRCIAKEGSVLNVATLEFFSECQAKQECDKGSSPSILSPKMIKSIDYPFLTKITGTPFENGQKVVNAFDQNMETFVNSISIGLDLKKSHIIKQIRFAPRNANNGIVIGDRYELFYFAKKWISAGVKMAKYNFIEFDNIPTDGVYWLRNLDHGKEELSFLYKDGKQIFINNDPITHL